ncbi:unnamed protein product [Acanthoscelides obtectus]|uniref:Uncharacterized protein n=1 Tax=Acanthoscelides obtectus TaxID=200917 RepID=A0A9P0P325_ACAOB|nr:unnamed protein product [Acanthoscelides obtectus]CAK1622877.1 hypothetical protein AOBTE_LOCUS1706 [Acanthoscelides obtectus]
MVVWVRCEYSRCASRGQRIGVVHDTRRCNNTRMYESWPDIIHHVKSVSTISKRL